MAPRSSPNPIPTQIDVAGNAYNDRNFPGYVGFNMTCACAPVLFARRLSFVESGCCGATAGPKPCLS
jgi:hypothetical protein